MANNELGLSDDTSHKIRINALSIFYAAFAGTWTLCLLVGAIFLLRRRNTSPVLRARGVALSIDAVALLHGYWVSVQLGYMLGPLMPGDAEYWIMSTWLPLGIALFHASNTRFLHVAAKQRRVFFRLRGGSGDGGEEYKVAWLPGGKKRDGMVSRFRRLDHTGKAFVLVGIGMAFQILLTLAMYLISRKWHSSWGIPGTEVHGKTEMERKVDMGHGWEWWPSVFWQIFWAWIVAPIILWRSRGIRDTQGWRLQTIACCLANLHAAPMWLIALYVPQMAIVNQYWIPPQWIAISIMITEIFTIFLPCWEVLRQQNLKQETLDTIAQWESKNQYLAPGGSNSIGSGSTIAEPASPGYKLADAGFKSDCREGLLTMNALEHVLDRNPRPLLEFSALRDFSGENIAFLTSVAEWKCAHSLPTTNPSGRPVSSLPEKMVEQMVDTEEVARERFNGALRIYTSYVSYRDADFQVNLPYSLLKKLEAVFEGPARVVRDHERCHSDPVTPFDSESGTRKGSASSYDGSSETGIVGLAVTTDEKAAAAAVKNDRVMYMGDIPQLFSTSVFDEAETSIKYLVLTNTWPKFVKERRSSMDTVASV